MWPHGKAAAARRLVDALRLAGNGLLDLVYPPRCLVCERGGRPPLCAECAAHFAPVPEPVCGVCGRPVEPTAPSCRACADQADGWGFDRARAAAVYEGPLRLAIQRFKYNRAEALGEPLGAFLANRCVVDGLLGDTSGVAGYDAVVPVPIHPVRARSRGFNQALLLAAPVAGLLGAPLAPELVRRVRKTPPQVGLTGDARRANPLNAFAVPAPDAVAGRRLLLIDDVFTTGATVSACAAALKAAGARRVDVATLAAGG